MAVGMSGDRVGERTAIELADHDAAPLTLADEQRSLVRIRILRAARRVLAELGLDTRVEDVAKAAGVSRRTVFRHFATRDVLVAAAVADSIHSYSEHVPCPPKDGDMREWLRDVLLAAHRMNARNGRIYWDLALQPDLDGALGEISTQRRDARRAFVDDLTRTAWKLAGGRRRPPAWLTDAFAVHLSAFTTQSLGGDFDRSPEEVGELGARVLAAALTAALEETART